MPNLHATIESHVSAAARQIAEALTPGIIESLRSATMEQLMAFMSGAEAPAKRRGRPAKAGNGAAAPKAVKATPSGRLPRRSEADLKRDVSTLMAVLRQHPEGLGAESIRAATGADKRALPKTLEEAMKAGSITKTGEKRATKYFVAGIPAQPKKAAGPGSGGLKKKASGSKKRRGKKG
jgi:hypothetical protein